MASPRFFRSHLVLRAVVGTRPIGSIRLGARCAVMLVATGLPDGTAWAAGSEAGSGTTSPAAPGVPGDPAAGNPAVGLDRLLTLPSAREFGVDKRGGATRGEWRSRFRSARGDVDRSKKKLAGLHGKLDEAAAESESPWRFAPPGATTSATENTENYSLTEAIRREKAELKRAETRLRDLEVEANLANVPEDWRQ